MRTSGILNPAIISAIADMRHTDFLAVVDVGTPVTDNTQVIDISFIKGIPPFLTVLEMVLGELVAESCYFAGEIEKANQETLLGIKNLIGDMEYQIVPHEELKKLVAGAKVVIRTGECSSYANIVLVGGVNF